MDLTSKRALVTGANGGLGEAFCAALARDCETVYAGVRRPAEFDPPAGNIVAIELDLSSRDSIERCFAAAQNELSSVDLMLNNAGALSVGLLEEQDTEKIYGALQVNLTGLIHLTKLVLPGMLERGEGKIVNNASFSGYVHFPLASVYAASKAGVVAFSESLRRELEGTGVSVLHLVTPGVDTGMLDATEEGYGEHFDTSGWDKIEPAEWAQRTLEAVRKDKTVLQPGGKTRAAILASRGPSALLDRAAGRMFKR